MMRPSAGVRSRCRNADLPDVSRTDHGPGCRGPPVVHASKSRQRFRSTSTAAAYHALEEAPPDPGTGALVFGAIRADPLPWSLLVLGRGGVVRS